MNVYFFNIALLKGMRLLSISAAIIMIFLQNPLTAHEASKAPAGHENNELSLKIIQLPEYIFGNATYATPIKFEIFGCQKALITKIEAKFHWEGHEKLIDISNRFVAYDGPQQNNGDSSIYTAFVPSSFYNNVLCYDYRSWSTEYELIVTFQPIDGNQSSPPVTLTSSQGSGKIAKAFADERIYCAELPVSGEAAKTVEIAIEGTETYVANDGDVNFYNMLTGNLLTPSPSIGAPDNYPSIMTGLNEAYAENIKSPNHIESYAKLSDWDSDIWGGIVYKATAYGNRVGAYFYTSYGGKFVDPLGSEPAMNLNLKSGFYTAKFSQGIAVTINRSQKENGLSLYDIVEKTASITLAIAPAVGLPLSATVKVALGAAAKIASIAAQVDSDDPKRINSAEAFVLYGHSFCAYGMEPIKSLKSAASAQNGTISQVINCGNEHFTGCQVGDQNAYFVQTQAAVTCESIPRNMIHYGESLVSYSKAAFYSSDEAFHTMRVTTRNLQ